MPIHGHLSVGRAVRVVAVCLVLIPLLASPVGLRAQSAAPTFATRAQLRERADRLEERLRSATLTEEGRTQVQAELARVSTRLEEGDFRPGDVVELDVWGNEDLTGTFTVGSGDQLQLPSLDPVDLSGVLYAEADAAIREHLRQFIQDVRIEVRPLKRVAVLGAVGSPGFYDLRPSASVADAIMAAGGPQQNAKIEAIELRRDGEDILEGQGRTGEIQTMTLEELAIRRGDQFYLPQDRGGFGFREFIGIAGGLASLSWAIASIF